MKLEAAGRKLKQVLGSAPRQTRPAEPLRLRQGEIREAVIQVLMQADEGLAPIEVRRRVASRIGRSVNRHTVTAMLPQLARDPDVPVTKVGPARYAHEAGDQLSVMPLTPRMEEVKARVLAVLGASSQSMRPAQVWTAVEAQLGEPVAYDTVAGFLSLAARHPDMQVNRVKQGWYRHT